MGQFFIGRSLSNKSVVKVIRWVFDIQNSTSTGFTSNFLPFGCEISRKKATELSGIQQTGAFGKQEFHIKYFWKQVNWHPDLPARPHDVALVGPSLSVAGGVLHVIPRQRISLLARIRPQPRWETETPIGPPRKSMSCPCVRPSAVPDTAHFAEKKS